VNDHELSRWLASTAGDLALSIRNAVGTELDESQAIALEKLADKAVNDYLLEQLFIFRPNDAILSEESVDDSIRLTSQRVWIIDPIDGTREFARRLPEFAIHVALWERAADGLIAGSIAIPNHSLVWSTADSAEISTPKNRPLTIVASHRNTTHVIEKLAAALAPDAVRLGYDGVVVRNCGSVGGKVHQILAGAADIYLSTVGFNEWDSAAPTAVAVHYGLVVTDVSGAALQFNRMPPLTDSFLVSRPELAAIVQAAVASL